jgi:hypothetical protein
MRQDLVMAPPIATDSPRIEKNREESRRIEEQDA